MSDKTQKAFVVDKADIASQKYDLSINRYKKVEYLEESYAPPREILRELKALEEGILVDLEELEAMLESQPIQERNGIPLLKPSASSRTVTTESVNAFNDE